MLFISRVSLMMLIPWAIGLGLFFDALIERRRTLLALSLGAICLAEQGVSTPSFDKRANRDDIATVSRRVRPEGRCVLLQPSQFALSLLEGEPRRDVGRPRVRRPHHQRIFRGDAGRLEIAGGFRTSEVLPTCTSSRIIWPNGAGPMAGTSGGSGGSAVRSTDGLSGKSERSCMTLCKVVDAGNIRLAEGQPPE